MVLVSDNDQKQLTVREFWVCYGGPCDADALAPFLHEQVKKSAPKAFVDQRI